MKDKINGYNSKSREWEGKVNEFRGYMCEKVEDLDHKIEKNDERIHKILQQQSSDIKDIKNCLINLKTEFLKRPAECPLNNRIEKLDEKITETNERVDPIEVYVIEKKGLRRAKEVLLSFVSSIIGGIVTLVSYLFIRQ